MSASNPFQFSRSPAVAQGLTLLIATAIAGGLSGIMFLIPNGIFGATLALCLSGGTLWLGVIQHRRQRVASMPAVLLTGLATGAIAGGVCVLLQRYLRAPTLGELGSFAMPAWTVFVNAILYGIALHVAYHLRITSRVPRRRFIGFAVFLCLTARIVVGAVELELAVLFLALFGAVPFTLLWAATTSVLDPAFGISTYRQPWEPEEAGTAPGIAPAGQRPTSP